MATCLAVTAPVAHGRDPQDRTELFVERSSDQKEA